VREKRAGGMRTLTDHTKPARMVGHTATRVRIRHANAGAAQASRRISGRMHARARVQSGRKCVDQRAVRRAAGRAAGRALRAPARGMPYQQARIGVE